MGSVDFALDYLFEEGYQTIAGVDEAGRGPLAGPVVAAACILPMGCTISGITDSKKLSSKKRKDLYDALLSTPNVHYGIGVVDSDRIDEINILQASLEAMKLAVEKLRVVPDFLLVDGVHVPSLGIPARAIVKGDLLSQPIGAASIIAKHYRDQLMIEMHEKWPEYRFHENKGYPTSSHLAALKEIGPCPIHRYSFSPVLAHTKKKEHRVSVNLSE